MTVTPQWRPVRIQRAGIYVNVFQDVRKRITIAKVKHQMHEKSAGVEEIIL